MTEAAMTGAQSSAFCWPVKVYYEDTDAQGVVYYANYLRFIERGRYEMFRACDISPSQIHQEQSRVIVVKRCTLDYIAPALLEDDLTVRTSVAQIKGASLDLHQSVWRGDTKLFSAEVKLAVLTSGDMRPVRVPQEVISALSAYRT